MDHATLLFLLDGARPEVGPAAGSLGARVAAERIYEGVVRSHVRITVPEAFAQVASRLAASPDAGAPRRAFDQAMRDHLLDPSAPVALLAPDVLVHAPALFAGAVFTHRLGVTEQANGDLEIHTDLAGFQRSHGARVEGGQLYAEDLPDGSAVWSGPYGWLDALPLDALLAVRVSADFEVTITALDAEPGEAPEVVALLRAVYDAEVALTGLPVTAEDLALGALLRDRGAFARARPPLVELAVAAGLQQRGHRFAHSAQVWAHAAALDREMRLTARLGPGPQAVAAVRAVAQIDEQRPEALDLLLDEVVLRAVTADLLDHPMPTPLAELAGGLVAAADRPLRLAVAHVLAAAAAEHAGRVLEAESLLRTAVAHGAGWAPAVHLLAGFESDRGAAPPTARAEAYLRRCHESGAQTKTRTLAQVADLDGCDESLAIDVLLHEGGWLRRFVTDRGPLLTAATVRVAVEQAAVERTVYEIVRAGPGGTSLVRDLRSGREVEIDGGTHPPGARVCGRVVPDGQRHRFVGVVLDVPPGRDRQLRRVLDRRDGRDLLAWVASATGPAEQLVDGDPRVHCRAVLQMSEDPTDALDAQYVPLEPGWAWIGEDGDVHGAAFLDGSELTASASSEARMDRLIADLAVALPSFVITSEERRAVRPWPG